ncbi:MAG: c-type cytochrome [Betaproteobacteria bacterium]|nr:c-type cytochrome [Betaproteobacteria bacterium]
MIFKFNFLVKTALVVTIMASGLAAAATPVDADQIRRGAYIATLGDCVACHTAKGGKPMAGGLELTTPFGIVHSTNITPDATTGIGTYTFEQFDRAMRKGVADDGHNLYPAMPYPSFVKIAPNDMHDLYAYIMHGVAPVNQPNLANTMQWPFSMRIGLAFWNIPFLSTTPFRYNPAQTPQWNRGAYIVEGLGHCGACHTPRGIAFEEKALTDSGDDGKYFLRGSTMEAWRAVNLRHLWTGPEVAQFLKSGQNAHGTAYGSMSEVVHFSSQHFSPGDAAAVGEYLNALSPNPDEQPHQASISAQASADDLYRTRGGLGYTQFCSTCHQSDGKGATRFFPPLASNTSVTGSDPTSAIHVVLSGWKAPVTQADPRAFAMPSYARLSDQELADMVTFVRTRWGNQGAPVTAEQVHKVREEIALKPIEPSKFVVPRYAAMLDSPNAAQLIYGMRLMQDTRQMLPNNVGDGLSCNSCHINGGTVAKAAPYVGLAAIFPSYAPRAGKIIDFRDRVNGCFLRSMAGKPLEKDSREMNAMIAYMDWMRGDAKMGQKIPGRGVGKIAKTILPNVTHGKQVYDNQCAVCHGDNGEGIKRADGSYLFPALWGDASFNIGAGMARTYTAAAFVKNNMPIANTTHYVQGAGGLTDQDAVDVAEYFTHMPRQDFPNKVHDWPNGGKPSDSRY